MTKAPAPPPSAVGPLAMAIARELAKPEYMSPGARVQTSRSFEKIHRIRAAATRYLQVNGFRQSRHLGNRTFLYYRIDRSSCSDTEQIQMETAIDTYLDQIANRALQRIRSGLPTTVHKVLEYLCQQVSAPGWSEVGIQQLEPDASPAAVLDPRLRQMERDIRSFVTATQPRRAPNWGPLCLSLGQQQAIVPDSLGTLDAIALRPDGIVLKTPGEIIAFCNILVRPLESAEDAFRDLQGLGLNPFTHLSDILEDEDDDRTDDTDRFSRGRIKKAYLFKLRHLRLANQMGLPIGSREVLKTAWDQAQAAEKTRINWCRRPKKQNAAGDAEEGWSELGIFLGTHLGKIATSPEMADQVIPIDDGTGNPLPLSDEGRQAYCLEARTIRRLQINFAKEQGHLTPDEAGFLLALEDGTMELTEIWRAFPTAKGQRETLERFIERLRGKLEKIVSTCAELEFSNVPA